MNLKTILSDRQNGLTQSRVILALFVLIDHQFAIFNTLKPHIFNTPIPLSYFAVYMFIFMSGLLCFESRSRNRVGQFLLNRFARIYPGYLMCLVISSLVFIPTIVFIARKSFRIDLAQFKFLITTAFEYLYANIAFTQNLYMPSLPGVDLHINAINGSLWTLQPEIVGYILIAIMFPFFVLIPRIILAISVLFSTLIFVDAIHAELILQPILKGYGFEIGTQSHLQLGLYLLSGIVYSLFSQRINVNKLYFLVVFFITLLLSVLLPQLMVILTPLLLPYLFISFCWFFKWPWGNKVDYSYGIYLYSFPIQQIFYLLYKDKFLNINFQWSFVFVIVFSCLCGVISFNLFEKNGQKFILRRVLSLSR